MSYSIGTPPVRFSYLVLFWTLGAPTAWSMGAHQSAVEPAEDTCTTEVQEVRDAYRRSSSSGQGFEQVLPAAHSAYECLGERPTEQHARVSEYEAAALAVLEQYSSLIQVLEYYFEHLADLSTPQRHANQLVRYAYALSELNAYAEALVAYTEAASLADELPPRFAVWQLAETAEWFGSLNRLSEAEAYLDAADSVATALDASHASLRAVLHFRRGQLYVRQATLLSPQRTDLLRAALELLKDAVSVFEADAGARQQILAALTELSTVYRHLDLPEVAERYLDRIDALDIPLDDYPVYSIFYHKERSLTRSGQGDHAGARTAAERARVAAEASGDLRDLETAHFTLGTVAEAEANTLSGPLASERYADAEAYYQRAMQYALDGRARYGLMDVAPAAWVGGQRPFRALVRFYLRQGRYAEAFATLDDSRARYFRDLRDAAQRRAVLTPRRRATLDSLVTVQEEARRALDHADLSVAGRSGLTLDVQRAQLAIDSVSALVSASAEPPVARRSVEAMQTMLRPQRRALVTFFLDEEEGAVFVLTADTLAVSPLSSPTVSNLAAAAYVAPGAYDPAPFHELYRALLGPFESVLDDTDALVVIPEGVLAGFPFALLTTAAASPGIPPPYLVRRHALATALSASSFFAADYREIDPNLDLLALGRTTFDYPSESRSLALRSGGDPSASFVSLPLVESELRTAHRHLGGLLLLDRAATKSAFFKDATRARVLHLASHALVDSDAPMSSYVVLASDEAEPGPSSRLYLSEIQQASLAADLVLLSACSTAEGKAHLSEGVIGLQYAFQAAGARSVLATAWPVNDAAMAELVAAFYGYLADGLSKDRALQRAQLDYLDRYDGALAHPAYWGGLTIQGDVTPLDIPPRFPWVWLLFGATLLAGTLHYARRYAVL
ncbi:MAG: CHAT domain-containing protein [Bacteroidota bacterium]